MSTTRIQLRGDTAANWTSANPVLAEREMGLETDTNKFKVGDGSLAWSALGYYSETAGNFTTLSADTIYIGGVDTETLYAPATMSYEFAAAVSDETTAITTGNAKLTFLSPAGFTVTGVTASLSTDGTTVSTIDVNKGGVSIFSTLLTIDANESDSRTAAVPAVITGGAWSQFDEITVDIDGAGTDAAGLKLLFTGSRTY